MHWIGFLMVNTLHTTIWNSCTRYYVLILEQPCLFLLKTFPLWVSEVTRSVSSRLVSYSPTNCTKWDAPTTCSCSATRITNHSYLSLSRNHGRENYEEKKPISGATISKPRLPPGDTQAPKHRSVGRKQGQFKKGGEDTIKQSKWYLPTYEPISDHWYSFRY